MKKVLLVFVGLVLLAQAVRLWERGQDAACVRRNVPAGIHRPHPGNGGGVNSGPKVMVA